MDEIAPPKRGTFANSSLLDSDNGVFWTIGSKELLQSTSAKSKMADGTQT